MDIGSANLRIWADNGEKLIDEPSVLLAQLMSGKRVRPVAYGRDCYSVDLSTTSDITAICPFKEGKVYHSKGAVLLVSEFLRRATGRVSRGNVFVCVIISVGLSAIERKGIEDVMIDCGYSNFVLKESCLGACCYIGAPAAITIDIGADVTDISLVGGGAILAAYSLNVGGQLMDISLIDKVSRKYGVNLDLNVAERAKRSLGNIYVAELQLVAVQGSTPDGVYHTLEITNGDLFEAVVPILDRIVDVLKLIVNSLSTEYATLFRQQGIHLLGGGAMLMGIDSYIQNAIGMPVQLIPRPMDAVGQGMVALLPSVIAVDNR